MLGTEPGSSLSSPWTPLSILLWIALECNCKCNSFPTPQAWAHKFKNSKTMSAHSKKATRSLSKKTKAVVLRKPHTKKINLLYVPHHYKRVMPEGVMYSSAVNTVSVIDPGLAGPPGWLSLSGVSTDVGGVTATGQFGFSVTPYLSGVTDYLKLTNLYQRYQIEKMEIEIDLIVGESYNGVASALPTLYSICDYGDAVAPTSLAAVSNFQNVVEHPMVLNSPFKRTFYPKAAASFYISAAATGYGTMPPNTWFDNASPGIPHYGPKFFIRNFNVSGLNTGMGLRIRPTLYLKFKDSF